MPVQMINESASPLCTMGRHHAINDLRHHARRADFWTASNEPDEPLSSAA
jgi:hypothetical protein